jgi:hypothetical protein
MAGSIAAEAYLLNVNVMRLHHAQLPLAVLDV